MADYDVFNGDADGLCALQQLRLTAPRSSSLITGVKRDIALLRRVSAGAGDRVTVLDIALARNRADLARLLEQGAAVDYFDHHHDPQADAPPPAHPRLRAYLSDRADRCTSLLVNEVLAGAQVRWAIVGAFGDNLQVPAQQLAQALGLSAAATATLRELGILLNYNGYGASLADLFLAPDAVFRRLHPFVDPVDFAATEPLVAELRAGYADDLAQARRVSPYLCTEQHWLAIFPAQPWARRVGGVYVNALAQQAPLRAHALLTARDDGAFLVSVRAPLAQPSGAAALCRAFGGGGRAAAAGIDELPPSEFTRFCAAFTDHFGRAQ